tara:strand:- start:1622 stop:2002 length:381 start_codon:yes stop_codon:yes gene_type:complete
VSEPRDILADRLNTQPAIFKGCSSSELGVMAGVSVGVWLPLGLLLAGLMGAVTMGFGIAGVGTVATVVALAGVFQRLKRDRPDGYYQQRLLLWLDERGLRRAQFVRRSGAWNIGRTHHGPLSPRDR